MDLRRDLRGPHVAARRVLSRADVGTIPEFERAGDLCHTHIQRRRLYCNGALDRQRPGTGLLRHGRGERLRFPAPANVHLYRRRLPHYNQPYEQPKPSVSSRAAGHFHRNRRLVRDERRTHGHGILQQQRNRNFGLRRPAADERAGDVHHLLDRRWLHHHNRAVLGIGGVLSQLVGPVHSHGDRTVVHDHDAQFLPESVAGGPASHLHRDRQLARGHAHGQRDVL